MRSDVTLGTGLSGGLDSSATICAMSYISRNCADERANKAWQHAYVACFPGTDLDETKYAKQVTDYLGIRHTFLTIDDAVPEREFLRQLYCFEEPVSYTHLHQYLLLYRSKKACQAMIADCARG